jgi:hypothetical protein
MIKTTTFKTDEAWGLRMRAVLGFNCGRAITASRLAVLAEIPETHPTCPNTRAAVRELVDEGLPILGTPKGFMLTYNKELVEREADRLASRATSILNRRAKLLKAASCA